jgi:hypothetical protein
VGFFVPMVCPNCVAVLRLERLRRSEVGKPQAALA